VVGVFVGAYGPEEMRACHDAVSELFAAGRLEVVPGPKVGFDDVPDALQAIADRRALGKTVVRIRS
jgi:NADPH:quinone reductase-like Zn-dependent oxidoreductase